MGFFYLQGPHDRERERLFLKAVEEDRYHELEVQLTAKTLMEFGRQSSVIGHKGKFNVIRLVVLLLSFIAILIT